MSASDEVRAKVEEWVEAIVKGDLDTVVAFFAPETSLFDVGLPLRKSGSEAVRERLKEWIEGYVPGKGPGFEFKHLEVFASEDVGYATGLNHVTGELKSGNQVDMWVRTTLGFKKRGGTWQIAHEHMSVPIDFKTLKASLDLQR